MAFKVLPQAQRGKPTMAHDDVTVSAIKPRIGRAVTQISFPRRLLRDAGLPDYPGAGVDVLLGDGSDLGSICIQPGTRCKLGAVGNGERRVTIRFSGIASDKLGTKRTTHELGVKALVVHMPPGFPWDAATLVDVANSAQQSRAGLSLSGQLGAAA